MKSKKELTSYLEQKIFPRAGMLTIDDVERICKNFDISFNEVIQLFYSIDRTSNIEISILSDILGKRIGWKKKQTYQIKDSNLCLREYYYLLELRKKIPHILADIDYKISKIKLIRKMERRKRILIDKIKQLEKEIEKEKKELGVNGNTYQFYNYYRNRKKKIMKYLTLTGG